MKHSYMIIDNKLKCRYCHEIYDIIKYHHPCEREPYRPWYLRLYHCVRKCQCS